MAQGSRAVKAEAELQIDPDKPVIIRETTIEYKGVEYTVRQDTFDDVELLEMLEDERYISLVRRIVGPKKWAEFKDSARTESGRVPAKELEAFLELVMGAVDPQDAS